MENNSNPSFSRQTQGGAEKTSRRDLISSLITVVLVVIIVVGGWTGLVILMGNTSPIMVVEGNSMHSYLEDGDLVLVKSVSAHELRDGDVIVFYSPYYNKNIVHRIKEIVYDDKDNPAGFVTKGDNNLVQDPGITQPEDVNGKVVGFIHYLGNVLIFLKSQVGIALVVIIIVFLALWSIVDERNRREKSETQPAEPAPITDQRELGSSGAFLNPFI
jgi:signal peptidase I